MHTHIFDVQMSHIDSCAIWVCVCFMQQKISHLAKDIEFHLLLLEIYKVYGALTVYVPIFKVHI
jgi:hypothetical protein